MSDAIDLAYRKMRVSGILLNYMTAIVSNMPETDGSKLGELHAEVTNDIMAVFAELEPTTMLQPIQIQQKNCDHQSRNLGTQE